jgi:hypothetical protein
VQLTVAPGLAAILGSRGRVRAGVVFTLVHPRSPARHANVSIAVRR